MSFDHYPPSHSPPTKAFLSNKYSSYINSCFCNPVSLTLVAYVSSRGEGIHQSMGNLSELKRMTSFFQATITWTESHRKELGFVCLLHMYDRRLTFPVLCGSWAVIRVSWVCSWVQSIHHVRIDNRFLNVTINCQLILHLIVYLSSFYSTRLSSFRWFQSQLTDTFFSS